MGIINALFGKSGGSAAAQRRLDHSVIISFEYVLNDPSPLQNLENELKKTIEEKQLGEYDGYEISDDLRHGSFYMYGSNAEDLFKGIKRILDKASFLKGAKAKLIFGGADR